MLLKSFIISLSLFLISLVIPENIYASTILIYSAGTSANAAYPSYKLIINNEVVKTFTNIKGNPKNREFEIQKYVSSNNVSANQMKIEFFNDTYIALGNDINLMIDKVVIDNKVYEIEDIDTFSTGTFNKTTSTCGTPSFLKSEWLHCNGYLQLVTTKTLAGNRQLKFGTSISYQRIDDVIDLNRNETPTSIKLFKETISREYNIITTQNEFKFESIHPGPPGNQNEYNFLPVDTIINFNKSNNITTRAHVLVWHQQLPTWILNSNYNKTEAINILKNHIKNIVTKYKNDIKTWDVVNEAVLGYDDINKNVIYRTNSYWYQKTEGHDFISNSFIWAREADPNAKLIYNDFSTETINNKSDGVYYMVKQMLDNNIPIDGVGFQFHIDATAAPTKTQMKQNLQRFIDLGLEVQITELDIAIRNLNTTQNVKLSIQAKIYQDILEVCLELSNCTEFITWGFTDKYSWINNNFGLDYPLPFDEFFNPKPAYFALRDTLGERDYSYLVGDLNQDKRVNELDFKIMIDLIFHNSSLTCSYNTACANNQLVCKNNICVPPNFNYASNLYDLTGNNTTNIIDLIYLKTFYP